MYERTLIKTVVISLWILTAAACVTENPTEESEHDIVNPEGLEQISEREKVEEPIAKIENLECASEIRIGYATAASRDPDTITFEIEGTNCGNHIIGFHKVVLAGDDEVPPTRGWDNVEVIENENGKFILHGEIWSCGFFRNADHIELAALSENGETAVFRIPITFAEEPTDG